MSKLFLSEIIKKTFLLATTLFFLPCGNTMAEEKMCTDLKKVNNLDEMLYQFYVNLDSGCLFTMPLVELEKAWGIKILSEERLQPGQTLFAYPELRNSVDFRGKPYHSEGDAFYVEADRRNNRTSEFVIYITEAYYRAHATLFPEGNYPKLLPEPVKKSHLQPPIYDNWLIEPIKKPDPGQPVHDNYPRSPAVRGKWGNYIYDWLNADRTHMIHLIPYPSGTVSRIHVYGEIPPALPR